MWKRLLFGIEAGGLLALAAAPGVLLHLWNQRALEVSQAIVALTPATLSAFAFAGLITLFPNLAGGCRMRWPMNIAFPIAFAGLNLVVARSIWFAPGVVEAPHSVLDPIKVWVEPKVILMAFAVQVVVLSLAARAAINEPSQAE